MTRELTVTTVDPDTPRSRFDRYQFVAAAHDRFEVKLGGPYYARSWEYPKGRWNVRVVESGGMNVSGSASADELADEVADEWSRKLPGIPREELLEAVKLLQAVAELS